MSAEENKTLYRRMIEEVFNGGDLDLVDELISPDYLGHDPSMPEEVRGPEGMRRYVRMLRSAFPDMRIEVEDQLADEYRVATRYVFYGTHEGELMGIPPTGNRVRMSGIGIDSFSDGKLVESWDSPDTLGMMHQLGAIPAPEEAQA